MRLGPEIDGLQWGKLHRLGAAHPAARTPLQHEVLDVPLQAHAGVASTLAAAFHIPPGTFETKLGANFRLLASFNCSATTRSICWSGKSGQPGSAHYTDQVEQHLAGEYAAIPFAWDEVEADAEVRTRLVPGK